MIPMFLIFDIFFCLLIGIVSIINNWHSGDTVLPFRCQENSLQNTAWFNRIDFLMRVYVKAKLHKKLNYLMAKLDAVCSNGPGSALARDRYKTSLLRKIK